MGSPKILTNALGAVAALTLLSGVAVSNPNGDNRKSAQAAQGESEKIVEVDHEKLYQQGISVDKLMDATVVDAEGNTVGEVEDMVVGGDDNRIVGMVVESGGFLDIGDSHLLYPFDKATIESSDRVQTEIRQSTAKELSLFEDVAGEPLEGDRWRASELIGGLAYTNGEPYGRVDDVIVDKSGNILAIVVQPDVMYDDYSYYAWPYVAYDPEEGIYDVPMDQRHAFGMEPLDLDKLTAARSMTAGTSEQFASDDSGRQDRQGDRPARGPSEEIVQVDHEQLYQEGISVDELMEATVVDAEGNDIGEVEDMVVGGDDNSIVGMIVETGGFLDIGDSHLLYPFEKASIESTDKVQTEIRQSTAKELSLFEDIAGEPLEGARWRASELIGGLAYTNGEPYGRVDDVIVDKSGNILAVVVQPDVRYDNYSYYAWPYVGYDPDEGIYDVPMDQQHAFGMEPLDVERLSGEQDL